MMAGGTGDLFASKAFVALEVLLAVRTREFKFAHKAASFGQPLIELLNGDNEKRSTRRQVK
jgi:hypothetical protein